MADVAIISNPNGDENLHSWNELERSVKAMQDYHGSVSNGSSTDNVDDNGLEVLMKDLKKDDPDYDKKVEEAVGKVGCVRNYQSCAAE